MALVIPQLLLGSVAIPFSSSQEISQSYTPLEAKYVVRTGNGTAIIRTAWKGKLATSIQGQGVLPAGFSMIDWTASLSMSCVGPRAVSGAGTSNIIVIPKARRTDTGCAAYARAIMSYNNDWEPTTFTTVNADAPLTATHDKCTLALVTNALQYQVVYYPKITVICNPPEESVSADAMYSWSLEAEEV